MQGKRTRIHKNGREQVEVKDVGCMSSAWKYLERRGKQLLAPGHWSGAHGSAMPKVFY